MPPPESRADDGENDNHDEPPALAQPCPHCGGTMVIVETFEHGSRPRAPPPAKAEAA